MQRHTGAESCSQFLAESCGLIYKSCESMAQKVGRKLLVQKAALKLADSCIQAVTLVKVSLPMPCDPFHVCTFLVCFRGRCLGT